VRSVAALPAPTTPENEFGNLRDRVARVERLLHSTVDLLHTLIEREQRGRFSRSAKF
jgi:hypothetical protein